MELNKVKYILLALAVIFSVTASAQPTRYRNAIILGQSTSNSFYQGTDGYICVMGGVPACDATTNLRIEKAIYNKRMGYASTSDSVRLAWGWGAPPDEHNRIYDWWGTFTNQPGYNDNYAALHTHMTNYNVIMIKECYVWQKYTSADSVLHDQARVRQVLDSMKAHPEIFWIWWTPGPHDWTNTSLTKHCEIWFSRWMKDTLAVGLDSYGAFPKNVHIYDYFRQQCGTDSAQVQAYQCCPGGSGCVGIPYDEHPNCLAVSTFSAAMIDEWFDAATYYENIHCNVNLTDEQPRLLKMAFQQPCDWDASRYDLVVGCLQDSLVVPRAKAYNPNLSFVPTRDYYGGGAFVGNLAGWWTVMPQYRVFSSTGAVVNYGSNPLMNFSTYCDNFADRGRFIEYQPDTLNDMIQNTLFDGWHSDNMSNPPPLGPDIDYDRNTSPDNNTEKLNATIPAWNIHDRNLRRNYGGGSSLGGGDTSLNQKLNIGWTFSIYYGGDTVRKNWINGKGIENPTGSNTAGTGNGWAGVGTSGDTNKFSLLLSTTRQWDRVTKYKPSFWYMTVIMEDSRGDMMTRDSLMKARWILGMGALTKMPVAIHDDDAIGMDHSSGVFYDEMERKLGVMNPDTVYRLSNIPGHQFYEVWVAFYDSGCVIFRSGFDYATRPVVTVTEANISGLYGFRSGGYYHPWGNQDTVRNNGQKFTSIDLRAKSGGTSAVRYRGDAVFLYSRRDTVITPVIVDNAEYPTSAQCSPATYTGGFTRDTEADSRWRADGVTPSSTAYDCDPKQSGIYLNPTYSDACWHTTGAAVWYQVYRQHYAQAALTQTATATYVPKLNRTGFWTLYEWHGYRGRFDATYQECDSVRVTISTATGDTVVYINQQINEGQWNLVGTFPYTSGLSYPLIVSNIGTNTSEYVLADAYMWVWGYGAEIAPPEEPPIAPTLSSPCGGVSGISVRPTFYWNSSISATSYRIQVSEYSSFAVTTIDQSGITATNYTALINLNAGDTYYWRVLATNVYGNSDWSTSCTFETNPVAVSSRRTLLIKP